MPRTATFRISFYRGVKNRTIPNLAQLLSFFSIISGILFCSFRFGWLRMGNMHTFWPLLVQLGEACPATLTNNIFRLNNHPFLYSLIAFVHCSKKKGPFHLGF